MPRSKGKTSMRGRVPSDRDARRNEVAEPPVRLVMAMTLLGVLVGALIAPAGGENPGVTDAAPLVPDEPVPALTDEPASAHAAARVGKQRS